MAHVWDGVWSVRLDPLRERDADAALALSAAEGWNQTLGDWRRLIALEPAGCFAARDGDRLIGTVTTTTYGAPLAWIGMMVVHPEHRGRGIGAALMRKALEHLEALGVSTIKLDATPAGRPLYASLGFAPETTMERWQGVTRPAGGETAPEVDRSEAWRAVDRTAIGADRTRLLDRLIAEGAMEPRVAWAEGQPCGYALARPGRLATYLGPLIAATPEAAGRLLDHLLAGFVGQEVCLDLHRGGPLAPAALAARGLSMRRPLTRMRRGAPCDGTPRWLVASAGPEFG